MKLVETHIGDILSNGAGRVLWRLAGRVLWRLDSPAPTGRAGAGARAACTPACMEREEAQEVEGRVPCLALE